jgi:hypothetical protein
LRASGKTAAGGSVCSSVLVTGSQVLLLIVGIMLPAIITVEHGH